MKTRIYFLISTTNSRIEGWSIFGRGTKKEMEQLSLTLEPFLDKSALHRDIYAQTLSKNLRVVSKTTAKRVYKLDVCDDKAGL
jgi:hypothetical protein